MREVAQAQAAIFLRRGNPVQAEFPHPRPQVARKRVVAVDLRGAWSDLVLGEGPGAVTDHRGALAEIEVEGTGRVGYHGLGAGRKARKRPCARSAMLSSLSPQRFRGRWSGA